MTITLPTLPVFEMVSKVFPPEPRPPEDATQHQLIVGGVGEASAMPASFGHPPVCAKRASCCGRPDATRETTKASVNVRWLRSQRTLQPLGGVRLLCFPPMTMKPINGRPCGRRTSDSSSPSPNRLLPSTINAASSNASTFIACSFVSLGLALSSASPERDGALSRARRRQCDLHERLGLPERASTHRGDSRRCLACARRRSAKLFPRATVAAGDHDGSGSL